MTDPLKKDEQRLAKLLAEKVIHEMLAKGHITDSDLGNRDQLFDKLFGLTNNTEFLIVIDHRESILKSAKEFLSRKKYDFSIIFYAMFFEHSINHLITHTLEKKKISKKAKMELIRTANIEAKFTWLLELLEMPKFNEAHKKTIINIANERNAFIHYKWNPISDDPNNDEGEKIIELINCARKSVTYIKKYESRVLYEKNKGKLKRILTKSS